MSKYIAATLSALCYALYMLLYFPVAFINGCNNAFLDALEDYDE